MSFTRPYVLRISARMATSPNQQGGVGAASGAIWMWTEACVILRGYSPFKMTFCFVDLLRRHLFLSLYNASPLLSTFFLISPAWCYLVAQLVGRSNAPTCASVSGAAGALSADLSRTIDSQCSRFHNWAGDYQIVRRPSRLCCLARFSNSLTFALES